jgi:adenosine kinase
MLATFCIEIKGTQEYRFTKAEFIERFSEAYGQEAANEISGKLEPRLVG